jgi:CRP-like cAMP-binding protein
MAKDDAASHRSNRLLAALSSSEFERLSRHMEIVTLAHRQVLAEPGEELEHAYFPHTGAICLVAVMAESGAAETAAIGHEGVACLEAIFGAHSVSNRILVQVSGSATRVPMRHMRALLDNSPNFRTLMFRYARARFAQISQGVACNGLHAVEERCARWLLTAHDSAQRDTFDLTQDFLAEMLGVHRPSVTIVARMLQTAGLIRYSRGVVTVTNRKGLEQASCECYGIVRHAFDELLPTKRR